MTQEEYQELQDFNRFENLTNTQLKFNREEYDFVKEWDVDFVNTHCIQIPHENKEEWINFKVYFKYHHND